MKPDKKSPEPAKVGALSDTKEAVNNLSTTLTDQAEIVNTSELKTIYNTLIDNLKEINHGIVSLELHIRDGRPCRFTVSRNESFLVGGGDK